MLTTRDSQYSRHKPLPLSEDSVSEGMVCAFGRVEQALKSGGSQSVFSWGGDQQMRECFILLACPKGHCWIVGHCRMVIIPWPSTVGQGWTLTSMEAKRYAHGGMGTECTMTHCLPLGFYRLSGGYVRTSHLGLQACARLRKLKEKNRNKGGYRGLLTLGGARHFNRLIDFVSSSE